MKIKDLIEKSWCGIDCYIKDEDSFNKIYSYILHNEPILKLFKGIVIASNFSDYSLHTISDKFWKEILPNCITINLKKNRGHSFGTADLDNTLFDTCKKEKATWMCKMSSDFILKEELLDREVGTADFYYTNNIGYGGIEKWNFNTESIISNAFLPQTNFYFLKISKIDWLNNKSYIDKTYEEIQNIDNYSGKPWEYFPYWTCEDFLKETVLKHKLQKENLLTNKEQKKLIETIITCKIHDGSHKNILVGGMCHLHDPYSPVILIS